MNLEKVQKLLATYGEEKIYRDGQYYRIKRLNDNEIELAEIVMDACGGSLYNPRIVYQQINQEYQPRIVENTYVTPIYRLSIENPDDQEKIHAISSQLLEKFQ